MDLLEYVGKLESLDAGDRRYLDGFIDGALSLRDPSNQNAARAMSPEGRPARTGRDLLREFSELYDRLEATNRKAFDALLYTVQKFERRVTEDDAQAVASETQDAPEPTGC